MKTPPNPRNIVVATRLTKEERELLGLASEQDGRPLANYMRNVLLQAAKATINGGLKA